MARIDLDKARAARREAAGEAPTFVLDEREFALPAEMPFEVIEKVGEIRAAAVIDPKTGEPELDADGEPRMDATIVAGAILGMFKIMLGDAEYAAFMQLRPSMDDLSALFDGVMAEYGVTPGESQASTSS